MMLLLLIVAIGFYFYKTGELQKVVNKFQSNDNSNNNEAKQIIDMRYASGQITAEEYNKIKNLL